MVFIVKKRHELHFVIVKQKICLGKVDFGTYIIK